MSRKSSFIEAILKNANTIARAMDALVPFEEEYFDNGYGVSGADEIILSDLTDYGISVADLTSLITCHQQLEKFFSDQAITVGDYRATINNVRRGVTGE